MRRFFGDYELLDEIARGGMGIVYRAKHISLNRLVAVKMVNSAGLQSASARMRFQIEADAIASLDHPNIISLYESGEHDGQLFFSMRLVSGGCFLDLLQNEQGNLRTHVAMLAKVARAVYHAHSMGVLHRDVKPSNILIDENGEPQLADFGLAKLAGDHADLTRTESVLGSPNYMAPEQASHSEAVTTAADVYSLGAVLYQTLTGVPPFHAGTPLETMRRVIDEDPTHPSLIKPKTDEDLEVVCLKCLEKLPTRRYQSAAAFADELDLWLSGRPVAARRVGRTERLTRWMRREPALATALAAITLLLLGVAVVSSVSTYRVKNAKKETSALLYEMQLGKVDELYDKGRTNEAMALLAKLCREHPDDRVLRRRLENLLRYSPIPVSRAPRVFLGGNKILAAQIFDESMVQIVTSSGAVIHINQDTGEIEPTVFRADSKPTALAAISSTTLDVAMGFPDGIARAFAADGSERCSRLEHDGVVRLLALNADGTRLATASGPTHVTLWKIPEGEPIWGPVSFGSGLATLKFNHDGTLLLASSTNQGGRLWDAQTGAKLCDFPDDQNAYVNGEISQDKKTVAFSSASGVVAFWDTDGGKRLDTGLFTHKKRANGVRFSSDGKRAVSYSADSTARLWDIENLRAGPVIKHAEYVSHAEFSSDGTRIVTGCHDGAAVVWDVETGDPITEPMIQQAGVFKVGFGTTHSDVRVFCYDGTAWKWEAGDALNTPKITELGWRTGATVMAPDNQMVAVGSARKSTHGNMVYLLNPATVEIIGQPFRVQNPITNLEFNADGTLLAAAAGQSAFVWDMASRTLLREFPFRSTVTDVCFATSGDQLAIGLTWEKVWISHVRNQSEEPIRLDTAADLVKFADRGSQFVTVSKGNVELWNIEDYPPTRFKIGGAGQLVEISLETGAIGIAGIDANFWSVGRQEPLA
ncbi:MAG: WD40 repeat protein/tRNA A-37 threonylcarbamoyl transferase component Bud32, partial [Verrucomicrobiales bacterium]